MRKVTFCNFEETLLRSYRDNLNAPVPNILDCLAFPSSQIYNAGRKCKRISFIEKFIKVSWTMRYWNERRISEWREHNSCHSYKQRAPFMTQLRKIETKSAHLQIVRFMALNRSATNFVRSCLRGSVFERNYYAQTNNILL